MKDFDIKNPTHQQIFDHAYLALKEQGEIAYNNRTHFCTYFVKNSTSGKESRCAIGHLLSKERAMEWALAVGAIVSLLEKVDKPAIVPDWMMLRENKDFLHQLQLVHDRCNNRNFVKDFEKEAQIFAKFWHLTIPEVSATV